MIARPEGQVAEQHTDWGLGAGDSQHQRSLRQQAGHRVSSSVSAIWA